MLLINHDRHVCLAELKSTGARLYNISCIISVGSRDALDELGLISAALGLGLAHEQDPGGVDDMIAIFSS